jgi:hypothetical protein
MIIKSFVALGFVIKIDDMFSVNFPKAVKSTAENLQLVIGKDMNTYKKIWGRIKRSRQQGTPLMLGRRISNVFVNLWFAFINNFYIVFYYYFYPLMIIGIQFAGFYNQHV